MPARVPFRLTAGPVRVKRRQRFGFSTRHPRSGEDLRAGDRGGVIGRRFGSGFTGSTVVARTFHTEAAAPVVRQLNHT